MKNVTSCFVAVFLLLMAAGSTAVCAQGAKADEQYVSRAEYEKLQKDFEALKSQMQQVLERQQVAAPQQQAIAQNDLGSVQTELQVIKKKVKELTPGTSNFLLTGYAFTDITDSKHSNSVFTAGYNPLFLYRVSDKLQVEAELELSLEDGATTTSLEVANMAYTVNDYMMLVGGKFLSPFGAFTERLHPKWINKLPNKPLGYPDGAAMLAPEQQIGVEARGGVPLIKETKANYAFYVSNGPKLHTDTAVDAGELDFTNTNENNNNKAFGGRVGFLPIPELEVGYSFETSRPGGTDTGHNVRALLQGLDISYKRDFDPLKGTIDLKGEQIWSSVDAFDYGTGAFKNNRSSHYLQLAYRPSLLKMPVVKNLEAIFRFDQINQPADAPSHTDEERYTWGLDYWLNPSTALKIAYMKDNPDTSGTNQSTFMGEFVVGF